MAYEEIEQEEEAQQRMAEIANETRIFAAESPQKTSAPSQLIAYHAEQVSAGRGDLDELENIKDFIKAEYAKDPAKAERDFSREGVIGFVKDYEFEKSLERAVNHEQESYPAIAAALEKERLRMAEWKAIFKARQAIIDAQERARNFKKSPEIKLYIKNALNKTVSFEKRDRAAKFWESEAATKVRAGVTHKAAWAYAKAEGKGQKPSPDHFERAKALRVKIEESTPISRDPVINQLRFKKLIRQDAKAFKKVLDARKEVRAPVAPATPVKKHHAPAIVIKTAKQREAEAKQKAEAKAQQKPEENKPARSDTEAGLKSGKQREAEAAAKKKNRAPAVKIEKKSNKPASKEAVEEAKKALEEKNDMGYGPGGPK